MLTNFNLPPFVNFLPMWQEKLKSIASSVKVHCHVRKKSTERGKSKFVNIARGNSQFFLQEVKQNMSTLQEV
jgi:thioester reductase-like protein